MHTSGAEARDLIWARLESSLKGSIASTALPSGAKARGSLWQFSGTDKSVSFQNHAQSGVLRQAVLIGEICGNEKPSGMRRAFVRSGREITSAYFEGGCGVKISRRAGSGFGLGFGAFLASLRPLSLLPMSDSLT